MRDLKDFRKMVYFVKIFFVLILVSCSENKIDTDKVRRTRMQLNVLNSELFNPFRESFEFDIKEFPEKVFLVRFFFGDDTDLAFIDEWGRDIVCVYDNERIYIYSFGSNGLDDNRENDDLVVFSEIEDIYLFQSDD